MKKIQDLRLIAIFVVVLIDVLGMTIMLPLLPYYSEHFGASPQVVGLLISVYALCQLVSSPWLGHLSDRFGRKPVLIVSQIGTFLGFLVLGFAQSLGWVFFSRIIDGATAGNISTAQAYITDVTEPKDRAKALGRIGIAFGIGFFIGPALTAFLFRFGDRVPIFAAAALSFLSILASTFLLPKETSRAHKTQSDGQIPAVDGTGGFWGLLKRPGVKVLFVESVLFYFAFAAFTSGFALFAEHRFTLHGVPLDPKQIGYLFTYFGLLQIPLQAFLVGKLVNHFGERKVQFMGFLASVIGYGSLSLITNPYWFALTGLFSTFGGGVLRPVLMSQITERVGPHERGKAIGLSQSLQAVTQILAPIPSTFLIGSLYIGLWGLLPALISLTGVIAMVPNNRNKKLS
ncbi:MAG TPA: MFS transporter [bacterium]|nr:MFS transporter [bacterium]